MQIVDLGDFLQLRKTPDQPSRFSALSCHRRSKRCESRLRLTKMATPQAEISASAANMRGIFI